MKMNNTYLHFVAYKEIPNWSVGYISGHTIGFTQKYPMVKIGKFICPSKSIVLVEDKVEYKQITLKINGGGAVLRGKQKGNVIGTKKQFIAKQGQFIMSKIDARNGAFGIVTAELDGAIVTGDFPLFDVDNTLILTEYLFLISTTKAFARFAQSCSRGTTNRQRIDVNLFLQQQIPLPSLAEQQALVDAYEQQTKNAVKQENQVLILEQQIDNTILEMLQVSQHISLRCFAPNRHEGSSFLEFYHFKELNRWDLYTQKSSYRSTIYPHVTFSKVMIDKPMYGAGYKSKKSPDEIRYIRITDINEDGSLNNDFVSAEQYDDKYLLKSKDFLIARSGNTVGKTFLYDEKVGKAIFAGYLIRFRFDETQVNLEYLLAYTKCSIFKQWVANNMRVSGQPNINSQQYMNASLILPPMEIQQQIAEKVRTYRQEIANCKATAATLRKDAITQFEQAIFE